MINIIHISDLHFGIEDQLALESFLAICPELNPDLIIITGDIANRARKNQYNKFKKFYARLPQPVHCVPGNHDIPLWDVFSRYLSPFANYEKYVGSAGNQVWHNNNSVLVGLNTAQPKNIKQGQLCLQQLQFAETAFKDAADKLKLIFFHHNIAKQRLLHAPLLGYELLLNWVKQVPVDIICTGHLHYAAYKKLASLNNHICLLSHAGSLSCLRTNDDYNSFHQIIWQPSSCQISKYIYKDNSFVRSDSELIE